MKKQLYRILDVPVQVVAYWGNPEKKHGFMISWFQLFVLQNFVCGGWFIQFTTSFCFFNGRWKRAKKQVRKLRGVCMRLGEILAWDSVTSLQVVDIRECVGIIKLLCIPLHTIYDLFIHGLHDQTTVGRWVPCQLLLPWVSWWVVNLPRLRLKTAHEISARNEEGLARLVFDVSVDP